MTPELREAARVIVLDTRDRVLLLRYAENGGFWATPGGSLEPGEDHHTAALRELHEELGVTSVDLGPQVATRSKDHLVAGRPARQVERYFIARIPADAVDQAKATQPDEILSWRWWSLSELSQSHETVYPVGLADLVTGFLQNGAPRKPARLAG
ncbi:NUDIX hydrolase [Sphaerisporangium viridialbum]|uniref:NUDIX hydrolase n=1 Tax=Sphaerisporangium viridialbum TaxID=46189 RepID=UPI003C721C34